MDLTLEPSPSMPVSTVDEHDAVVGTTWRNRVLAEGENFRVAHLFLFNSTGELLLQQLGRTRERHPLAWGASVAAYLFEGERYDAAIIRRTIQELDFEPSTLSFHGKTAMRDETSLKFIGLFVGHGDGPFHPAEGHIERVEFVKMSQIAEELRSGTRTFTPTFQHLFDYYTSRS